METRFLKEALFGGMTSNSFKLGTVLTLGWFWMRLSGCHTVYRGQDGNIDDDNIQAVMNIDQTQVSIEAQSLPAETIWHYIRRQVSCCGLESQNSSACIIRIDSNGNMIGSIPNIPVSLIAQGLSNGRVRLRWRYAKIDQEIAPTGFHIYIDSGSGFDFNTPDATVAYHHGGPKAGEFNWISESLTHGELYRFCVRAYREPEKDLLNVTGELSPDATCDYQKTGVFNEKPYYRRNDGAWYIWWNGSNTWSITTVLGKAIETFWYRYNSNVLGEYTPVADAEGIATVAEGSHLPSESQNTSFVSAIADSLGPDAIINLITSLEEI